MRMRSIYRTPADGEGVFVCSAVALIYTLLFLLSGCGMLRKVEKESNESFAAEHVDLSSDSLVLNLDRSKSFTHQERTDSAHAGYVMEIWPKGKFSISKDGIFEGEALKISMRGQHTALKKSSELTLQEAGKVAVKHFSKQHIRQEASVEKQDVVRKNPAWNWALILLAVAIGINFYYNRQLK